LRNLDAHIEAKLDTDSFNSLIELTSFPKEREMQIFFLGGGVSSNGKQGIPFNYFTSFNPDIDKFRFTQDTSHRDSCKAVVMLYSLAFSSIFLLFLSRLEPLSLDLYSMGVTSILLFSNHPLKYLITINKGVKLFKPCYVNLGNIFTLAHLGLQEPYTREQAL
jgi:hypothetical protein